MGWKLGREELCNAVYVEQGEGRLDQIFCCGVGDETVTLDLEERG